MDRGAPPFTGTSRGFGSRHIRLETSNQQIAGGCPAHEIQHPWPTGSVIVDDLLESRAGFTFSTSRTRIRCLSLASAVPLGTRAISIGAELERLNLRGLRGAVDGPLGVAVHRAFEDPGSSTVAESRTRCRHGSIRACPAQLRRTGGWFPIRLFPAAIERPPERHDCPSRESEPAPVTEPAQIGGGLWILPLCCRNEEFTGLAAVRRHHDDVAPVWLRGASTRRPDFPRPATRRD